LDREVSTKGHRVERRAAQSHHSRSKHGGGGVIESVLLRRLGIGIANVLESERRFRGSIERVPNIAAQGVGFELHPMDATSVHVGTSFQGVGHAPGRYQRRGGTSMGTLPRRRTNGKHVVQTDEIAPCSSAAARPSFKLGARCRGGERTQNADAREGRPLFRLLARPCNRARSPGSMSPKNRARAAIEGGKRVRARRPRCPQCGGPLGHSTAIITGGAMRVVGGRAGRVWVEETGRAEMFAPHKAIGFLHLLWHQETAPGVAIVEAAPSGQFELYLCSIACLRAFMTARVDDLEKLAKKESGVRVPRKPRTTDDDAGLSASEVEAIPHDRRALTAPPARRRKRA
jgi:hypothetical protein